MRSLVLMVSLLAALALGVVQPALAQNATTSPFDHDPTGFPLTGTHLSVSCASCHVNGRMANTPTQCIGCHNTMTAPGAPQSHPKTTNRCDGCHQTTTWRDFAFIDHAQATGPCASCHNNKSAIGKGPNHVATNAACGNCHHNTVSFAGATTTSVATTPSAAAAPNAATLTQPAATTAPATKSISPAQPALTLLSPAQPNMSHAGVTNGCVRCHNGSAAVGKPPNHVVTAAPCENCHKSTVTFAGAGMNHAGILGNCASCHSGGRATGKPANHVVVSAPCESCHKSTVTFEGARFDHRAVMASCASCHNGVKSEGKPAGHFVTTLPCETCHRATSWIPANYRHTSPAYVNHGAGVACSGCHIGNAQVVAWKFPAFRPGCAGCHANQFRPTSHPKFERPVKVYYTISELRDCTGACHIYTDNTQRTIQTRQSGLHRLAGGGW